MMDVCTCSFLAYKLMSESIQSMLEDWDRVKGVVRPKKQPMPQETAEQRKVSATPKKKARKVRERDKSACTMFSLFSVIKSTLIHCILLLDVLCVCTCTMNIVSTINYQAFVYHNYTVHNVYISTVCYHAFFWQYYFCSHRVKLEVKYLHVILCPTPCNRT